MKVFYSSDTFLFTNARIQAYFYAKFPKSLMLHWKQIPTGAVMSF
jgi:hypothetical protein